MTNRICEKDSHLCNNNGSNRLIYDDCYYNQYIHGSVSPFIYQMYEGKFENCGKCRKDHFYHPYDLVDVERELKIKLVLLLVVVLGNITLILVSLLAELLSLSL